MADFFAREYVNLQRGHWGGIEARARYYVLADILKQAMDKKILSLEDLEGGDDYSVIKLIKSKDSTLFQKLNILKKLFSEM